MKTFSGWRAVGQAMRWARRQEGVKVKREKKQVGAVLMRIRTYRLDDGLVQVRHWHQSASFWTFSGVTGSTRVDPNTAAEALRVLAALDLIPAHLAEAPDERYGRCQRCGRLARWWNDQLAARWVHVVPLPIHPTGSHLAEVDA